MTVTQTVDIPANRRVTLEVPREVPTGRTNIIIQFPMPQEVREAALTSEKKPVFGCLKGQIWMSDDFDEPLEDFKDYMKTQTALLSNFKIMILNCCQ